MKTCEANVEIAHERALVEWYGGQGGEAVLNVLRPLLENYYATRFGYIGAQVGLGGLSPDLLCGRRVPQRLVISPLERRGQIQARADALPLATESVDFLLVAHVLESACDPYQVLRELERVLVPEGDIVLISFNPWSLWRLMSWAGLRSKTQEQPPWAGRFFPVFRIRGWLRVLGFEIIDIQRRIYFPPYWKVTVGSGWRWLETASEYCLPIFGGVRMIVARKRRPSIRLIRPKWQGSRGLLANGAINSTSRIMGGGKAG